MPADALEAHSACSVMRTEHIVGCGFLTSSPESADFPSGSSEPECEPSPSASSTPTAGACSLATGLESLSTTTCVPSTACQQTLFAEASPARTSAASGAGRGLAGQNPVCSESSSDSSAWLGPLGCSPKTPHAAHVTGSQRRVQSSPFLATSPLRSTPRPRILERTTNGTGALFLPTPVADDVHWRRKPYAQGGRALSYILGGPVNPTFLEWMMGFPAGWTAVELSATPSSRSSSNSSAGQS